VASSLTASAPPTRAATGSWVASQKLNESMVWMRSVCGSSARRQPRAAACASAAAASGRRVGPFGSSAPISPRSARTTRARISAAALRVKVMARISPGSSTRASSVRKRCVSTAVLPEPAGASSSTEPEPAPARARAWSSSRGASLIAFLERVVLGNAVRADAAHRLHVAVLAGAGRGIDARLAGEEGAHQRLEALAPGALLRRPVPACRRQGPHPRQDAAAGRDAGEAHLARRDVDGGEPDHVSPERGQVGDELRVRRPLAVPVRAAGAATLVVEHEPPAPDRVDAVEAQRYAPAGQLQLRRLLGADDGEGCARALQLAQPPDERRGAPAFARESRREHGEELELAPGPAAAAASAAHLELQGARGLGDALGDERIERGRIERGEARRVLQPLPQALECRVQQDAALVGGNARLGTLRGGRAELQLGERAEAAGALQGQGARAGDRPQRVPGRAALVDELLGAARTGEAL